LISLRKKILSGALWVSGASVFRQLVQFLSLVVFARILSPDDFGLYSILVVLTGFLGLFSDMGTSSAIIHKKEPTQALLSSILYFNVLIGVVLFLTLSSLSGFASEYFGYEQLAILIPLISVNFIIASLGVVQKALYEKEMDFKSLAIFENISELFGALIGIVFAFSGAGVFSLVSLTLAKAGCLVVLLWWSARWRPILHFSIAEIKGVFSYISGLLSFNIVNYMAKSVDKILIGRYIDAASLGVYNLAHQIMLYPVQNVTFVLIRILFPALSKLQDDNERFKRLYLRALLGVSLVTFPLMIGVMVTADVIVPVIFGEKWKGLAEIVMILAPVGMMKSIFSTTGSIYMAKGKTNVMFVVGLIGSAAIVTSFVIGVNFGIRGVAISFAVANALLLVPVLRIAWMQIELSLYEGISVILPVLLVSLFMGAGVLAVGHLLSSVEWPSVVKLFVEVGFGVALYMLLVRTVFGEYRKLLTGGRFATE